jgi:hypothetical protein
MGYWHRVYQARQNLRAGMRKMLDARAARLLDPSASNVSRNDRYVRFLAGWVLRHPESAHMLRPEGVFHRCVLEAMLRNPKMTLEYRAKLAGIEHLLPYLV